MLVYMIHELLEEKKFSVAEVNNFLNSYAGDAFAWYESLDCVSEGWRRPFFKKYLTMPYSPILRSLYQRLDESQILSTIAYSVRVDANRFMNNTEAREKALEMLSGTLGKLEALPQRRIFIDVCQG